MIDHELEIGQKIYSDPLGDIYQAKFENNSVIIKQYHPIVSKAILDNLLEFKTLVYTNQENNNDIILKVLDVINHNDNILLIYDYHNQLKFLNEYIDLEDNFSQDIDNLDFIDNSFGIELIYPLVKFLKGAHDSGYFHGLLNPHTICFTEDNKVRLFGFGFEYKIFSWISCKSLYGEFKLNSYLSYNAIEKNQFSCLEDIYAVAAIIYTIFSGNPPYDNIDANEASVLDLELQPISGLSHKKFSIFKKALDVNSKHRLKDISVLQKYFFNSEPYNNLSYNSKRDGLKNYGMSLGIFLLFGVIGYELFVNNEYVNARVSNKIAHLFDNNLQNKELRSIKTMEPVKIATETLISNKLAKNEIDPKIKTIDTLKNNFEIAKLEKQQILAKKKENISKEVIKENQESKISKVSKDNDVTKKASKKLVKRYYKIKKSLKDSSVCKTKVINGSALQVCNDILKNQIRGPEYYSVKLDSSNYNNLNITTPIRVIDYKKYCYFTKKCDYFTTDPNYNKTKILGKEFADVMGSIKQYNIYCLLTDNCTGLNDDKIKQPIIGLNKEEIRDYVNWLNMVSGSEYKILENKVVLNKITKDLKKDCNSTNQSSNVLCKVILNNYKNMANNQEANSKQQIAYVLVRK
tara:strand:+ start:2054 stop:3952 length:1899 start_codon:yes stop_codon:yes gene_type:complete